MALHRLRLAAALSDSLGLRIEEFPYPVDDNLAVDMVFNPWLQDGGLLASLRQLPLDAAATLG